MIILVGFKNLRQSQGFLKSTKTPLARFQNALENGLHFQYFLSIYTTHYMDNKLLFYTIFQSHNQFQYVALYK